MQNNNPQYNDFFCHGPWAVVDGFSDALWINVEHKPLAMLIAKAFSCKLNAVVVDISKATNYHPNLIDSTVVSDWSIEPGDRDSHGLPGVNFEDYELSDYSAQGRSLVNKNSRSSLTAEWSQELHQQIISFILLLRDVCPDLFYFGKELDRRQVPIVKKIMDCYSIELTVSDIKSRLFDLALNDMDQHPRECLLTLNFIGRLYD